MPSSYEPWVFSQILALKARPFCLLNNAGGLQDNVKHLENIFCFRSNSIQQQISNLSETFEQALCLYIEAPINSSDYQRKLRAAALNGSRVLSAR